MNPRPGSPRAFDSATVERPHAPTTPLDPLRLCVNTTVALIAWVITPALAVAVFGALGTRAYVRARREGLLASRCKLGDTRLVIAYLATLTLAGTVATVLHIAAI